MKRLLILAMFIYSNLSFAQECDVKDKWKCGNDPRFKGSNNITPMKDTRKTMCDRCLFDRVSQLSQWPDPYPTDWQTIFTDNFDASTIDLKYYTLMFQWGNNPSPANLPPSALQ